MEWKFATGNNK